MKKKKRKIGKIRTKFLIGKAKECARLIIGETFKNINSLKNGQISGLHTKVKKPKMVQQCFPSPFGGKPSFVASANLSFKLVGRVRLWRGGRRGGRRTAG